MPTIRESLQVLKDGGLIGFPTDTVYGIGVDASNISALTKLYELKNRAPSKPLILFIKSKTELNKYVSEIPALANKLIDNFWPGPLTIIFKSNPASPIYGSNLTIGIRIPNYEPILIILKCYEHPLATTSANLEGTPAPISDIGMNIKPDFLFPGRSGTGIQSTIIDITAFYPIIVREGGIKKSEIEEVIGLSL